MLCPEFIFLLIVSKVLLKIDIDLVAPVASLFIVLNIGLCCVYIRITLDLYFIGKYN